MNIERELYELVRENIQEGQELSPDVVDGIIAYANANGLPALLSGLSDDVARLSLRSFMEPILDMPSDNIVTYFQSYRMISSFKLLSNRILEQARRKSKGFSADAAVLDELEPQLAEHVSALRQDSELGQTYAQEISDCLMDLDYAAGRTSNISLRLRRELAR